MAFLEIEPDDVVELASCGDNPEARHRFELRQVRAINAALAAARPLLVRGEPGIGKTQLARAAAKALGWAFVQQVVDSRTESRDLLWHFDAVGRLAKAQVLGALQLGCSPPNAADGTDQDDAAQRAFELLEQRLALDHFLHPRALWWAFAWDDALKQATRVRAEPPPQLDGGSAAKGCVVLIDEIDKAETDVPNGLLEALGAGRFTPEGRVQPVEASSGARPLVIITTNEERSLPDAFVRRCMVLQLALPKDRSSLIATLAKRGETHFTDYASGKLQTTPAVLQKAATLLADDRAEAERRHWRPLPGQAEYLDLLRAVIRQAPTDPKRQAQLLDDVAEFALKKHRDAMHDRLDAEHDGNPAN